MGRHSSPEGLIGHLATDVDRAKTIVSMAKAGVNPVGHPVMPWPPTRHALRIRTRWTPWRPYVTSTVTTAELCASCTPSGPSASASPTSTSSPRNPTPSASSPSTSSSAPTPNLTYQEVMDDPNFRRELEVSRMTLREFQENLALMALRYEKLNGVPPDRLTMPYPMILRKSSDHDD